MALYHIRKWYKMNMKTRTNLHLETSALRVANAYANAKGITLGLAVSELILRGEHGP